MSHARFAAVRTRGGAEPSSGTAKRSKFVDQASSRPAAFAEKTTDRPSGWIANSSAPPKGLLGLSASIAFIRSTASPPETGTTNRWERRPSFQASQWRTKSFS